MDPRDLQFESMSMALNAADGISSKYTPPAVVMVDGTLRRLEEGLSESVLRAFETYLKKLERMHHALFLSMKWMLWRVHETEH